MGTMALATVLINGGTAKALLRALGFMSYTPEQLATLQVCWWWWCCCCCCLRRCCRASSCPMKLNQVGAPDLGLL